MSVVFSRRLALAFLATLALVVSLVGCGKSYPPPANLPPPIRSTSVGPGDVIDVHVVGEEKLPQEFEVQPDGTLDFPYVRAIKVNGLEPHDVALAVRKGLIDVKYLTDPQVTVKVKQYNSKKINVLGQVARPGPIPFTEGLTVVDAISATGGFTPLADSNAVVLIRQVSPTKSVTVILSIDAMTDGTHRMVKLQAGDTIKVDQRLF
ncbi:MAG: polysaccharide biosynthesis/export family protein [Myxococcales bacterium]|nr:polysaccharide biosynthesis/export family protein [Myxococcales bacterium]